VIQRVASGIDFHQQFSVGVNVFSTTWHRGFQFSRAGRGSWQHLFSEVAARSGKTAKQVSIAFKALETAPFVTCARSPSMGKMPN